MAHTRAAVLAYPSPEILRIEHSQANPLKLSLAWDPAEEMPASLTLRAEIHPSRSVADDATPLAAVTLAITDADTQPWTLEFSSQQTNLDLGGRDQKTFVLTISGIETSTRFYTLADADLVLFRHPCSQLVPAAVSPLLYATTEDLDAIDARLTVVEETGGGGGGGAQADWNATTGPAVILNKPTLGNSSSRNVGTGAGDVATGNHTHNTSQITGLDTALAGKAASSHTHSISDVTGLQAALDGKAASSHTHTTSQITGLDTALAGKAASTHTHSISDVTGLQAALDGKAASSHTHSIGQITGLGSLAALSTVGTSQITDGAVTQVKLWSGFVNGTKALPAWSARDNQPPATAFATIDTRNGQYVLDFDDGAAGANERAVFAGIIPAEFSLTGGFKVRVHWWASSINTAHRVKWTAEVDRRNTDASTDSGAWGSIHSALGPPDGTQFKPTFTEITLTSIDGLVAGEPFRLRISRDSADSANDTMVGDAELFGVQIIGN